MKRIGMLTSGGDCQSLNATMRGVVKGLNVLEGTVEIYGFIDGYKGLIYGNYKRLTCTISCTRAVTAVNIFTDIVQTKRMAFQDTISLTKTLPITSD